MKKIPTILLFSVPSVVYVLFSVIALLSGGTMDMFFANIVMAILSTFFVIKKDKFGLPRSKPQLFFVFIVETIIVLGGAFCISFFPKMIGVAVYLNETILTYCKIILVLNFMLLSLKYICSLGYMKKKVSSSLGSVLLFSLVVMLVYTAKMSRDELRVEHDGLDPVTIIKTVRVEEMKEELDKFTVEELNETYGGETPINSAIARGYREPIKYLKKRGVDLNKRALYKPNAVNSTFGYFFNNLFGSDVYKTAKELNEENKIREEVNRKNKVIGTFSGRKTKKAVKKLARGGGNFALNYNLHYIGISAIAWAGFLWFMKGRYTKTFEEETITILDSVRGTTSTRNLTADEVKDKIKNTWLFWIGWWKPILLLSIIILGITFATNYLYKKAMQKGEGTQNLSKSSQKLLNDYISTKTLLVRIVDIFGWGRKKESEIVKEINELEAMHKEAREKYEAKIQEALDKEDAKKVSVFATT